MENPMHRCSTKANSIPLAAQSIRPGLYAPRISVLAASLEEQRFVERLWHKDTSVWSTQPLPELEDRLGWLDLPATMHSRIDAMKLLGEGMQRDGIVEVVLLGMGGSSLAPEVFQLVLGNRSGFPRLSVLDTTHPAAIAALRDRLDFTRTLFVVSSKSGTTIETASGFHYFWSLCEEKTPDPGSRFVAITDHGTPLAQLALERGFRNCFESPPDVGGRFAALTPFGLVPAALIGADVHSLLDRGLRMAEECRREGPLPDNPGVYLGVCLGELVRAGRDKVTFLTTPSLRAFPAWAEQLIAESTGKDDRGIVPVADETPDDPASYGGDRVFVCMSLAGDPETEMDSTADALAVQGHPVVRIRLPEKEDVAQECFRWEIAVATAGSILGIHPFNQPDVQQAKDLARQSMKEKSGQADALPDPALPVAAGIDHTELARALESWLYQVRPGDYAAIQAYLSPDPDTRALLQTLKRMIRSRTRAATTLGFGPRFLHSTGQLHKGGPNTGVFLQIVDRPEPEIPVPEAGYTFNELIQAQALGDYRALLQRGRRILRLQIRGPAHAGLALIAAVLGA